MDRESSDINILPASRYNLMEIPTGGIFMPNYRPRYSFACSAAIRPEFMAQPAQEPPAMPTS